MYSPRACGLAPVERNIPTASMISAVKISLRVIRGVLPIWAASLSTSGGMNTKPLCSTLRRSLSAMPGRIRSPQNFR